MQVQKPDSALATPARSLSTGKGSDPRERFAGDAARPSVPQPRSERLAGPFRVKSSYLERVAWPYAQD